MFESLELRRLLSGGTRVWISEGTEISLQTDIHLTHTGTLAIKGTDAADSLSVTRNGKFISYQTKNGDTIANFFTEASKVKRILIEAGSGDDHVYICPYLGKTCTIVGGSGNDRIDGSFGATLIGGSGNDRLFAAPPATLDASGGGGGGSVIVSVSGTGPAVLSGGLGNDTLVGNEGDDFAGGAGIDRGVIYLPASDPKTVSGTSVGGKQPADFFTDATGLEILSLQVGTGKDAGFIAVYDAQRGT